MELSMSSAIAILSCIIGVCTFVTGMIARGKNDGQMMEKINQCIKGVDEIKKDLKETTINYNNLHLMTAEQESRLRACEEDIKSIFKRLNKEE